MPRFNYNFFVNKVAENKSLAYAILVSLALHFLLFTNSTTNLPETTTNKIILNIQLNKRNVNSELHSNITDVIANNPKIKTTQNIHKHKITKQSKPIGQTSNPIEADNQNSAPTGNAISQLQSFAEVQHDTSTLIAPTNLENTETRQFHPNSSNINSQAYKYVETEFETTSSNNPHLISKNTLKFTKIEENGSYLLDNTDATTGAIYQLSEGTINSQGLRPNYFHQQDSNDPSNALKAIFAWGDGSVEVNGKYQKLSEKMFDDLSYLYQFMFFPPNEVSGTEIVIATPLQSLAFRNLGEETILTSLGELKTIHLVSNQGTTVDIWLALDYQFIPVKIRQTTKDGHFTEQTASKITTTLPQINPL